jgi:hypothetical protein
MGQGSLVREQIDQGAIVLKRLAEHFPVQAAFWLKADENSAWMLHLVFPEITDASRGEVARTVVQVAGQSPQLKIEPAQVMLVRMDPPLARWVLGVLRPLPQRILSRTHKYVGEGVPVQEAYIYPAPVSSRYGRKTRVLGVREVPSGSQTEQVEE